MNDTGGKTIHSRWMARGFTSEVLFLSYKWS